MLHNWSRLLSEIEDFATRQGPSTMDEDEQLRPRRVAGSAQAAPRRLAPTGIASKAGRGPVSPGELSISSILMPPQSSQQAIISLVDNIGANWKRGDEEELARSGGGAGGGSSRIDGLVSPRGRVHDRSARETASRAAIAAGAQPVVIKVTSTVSSRASAAGLMTYLGTREVETEGGEKAKVDIAIYDQDGIAITNREERGRALAKWGAEFREAYAVNALATLSLTLAEAVDDDVLHDALNSAFASKPFLYARHQDGTVSVYAVTDLPAKKIAGALKAREAGEGQPRGADKAETELARRLQDAGIAADVRILGAAITQQSGRYFLEKFLRTEKSATMSTGDALKRGAGVKEKADGIWRAWSSHIRTVEPRTAFHVIFSARAGTDPEAMKLGVRDFLGEQVAGHRWITAHHPETGHVHVHAMISARDDLGRALRLTKPELYEWRERFAAKAREHGIAMVATRRADVAATRPYSQAQAGASERGRADPRYLKTAGVAKRVERKRAGALDPASLSDGNLGLASKWQAAARALQRAGAEPSIIAAADRFAAAAARKAKGFVIVRVSLQEMVDREAATAAIQQAIGVDRNAIFFKGKTVTMLAPTTASVSKIERELINQKQSGPGAETRKAISDLKARLLAKGLHPSLTIEAAGSAKNGVASSWLRKRFERSAQANTASSPRTELTILISSLKQQKGKQMPLSLEQFDERVARANKSIDRLETMVDSSGERQAVEEMRREISALFAEQRRDIELQHMPSVTTANGGGGTQAGRRGDEVRGPERATPPVGDPAIAAQQQAIAAGRAARAVREQAGAAKGAQEEQRQQVLRQAEQERQRDNGRDGAER